MSRWARLVVFVWWLVGGLSVAAPDEPREWRGERSSSSEPPFVARPGEDEIVVIRSADEWAQFWRRVGLDAPQGFDAASDMAVAVLPGRPIPLFLEILAVRAEGGDVVVHYAPVNHWSPPPASGWPSRWQYRVRLLPRTSARIVGRAWNNAYEFLLSEMVRQPLDPALVERMTVVAAHPKDGVAFCRAVPAFAVTARFSEPMVRRISVEALAVCGSRAASALPSIIDAIADSDANVRLAAVVACERLGAEARTGVPALAQAMTREPIEVRWRVASALGAIGPEAAPAVPLILAEAFRSPDRWGPGSVAPIEGFASILRRIGIAGAPALLEQRRSATPAECKLIDDLLLSIYYDFNRSLDRLWWEIRVLGW
jgi:HEAT repeat protein